MKKILTTLSVFLLLILSTSTFAQENNTEPISCFDYYKFGSVYSSLETKNSNNISGSIISFSGEIKNENNYPIVDGKLFAKIMRKNPDYAKNHGQDEVDSFVVKEGISIPTNSSVPIDFDWEIPSYAISGEYQLATYFLVDDSFNMSGLSFTNDIKGESVFFQVQGDQKYGVFFDRSKMGLNEGSYLPVTFTPLINPDEEATIELTLTNETNQIQRVPVTLDLYEWDAQASKNLLKSDEVTYLINPKSSIKVPYTVTDTKQSVYYLLVKAQYRDTKSEVAVRFGRNGVEEPRINFSTFSSYPFEKGVENNLITCVHNTNDDDIEFGKVITTIRDHNGNAIHTSQYEGLITSAIQGIESKFTPKANYKDLTIETKVYNKDGDVIDQTNVDYKCSDLLDDCTEPVSGNLVTVFIIIFALIALIIIFITMKHMKKKDLLVSFTLVFIMGAMMLPSGVEAKAASPQWSYTLPRAVNLINDWMNFDGLNFMEAGGSMLYNVSFSASYFGTVNNLTTEQTNLSDGALVNVGDTLRFNFGPNTNFWWRSGSNFDTPPGEWEPDAGPRISCDYNNYYVQTVWGQSHAPETALTSALFANFSVNPPTQTLSGTSNLTCDDYVEVDDGDPETNLGYVDCRVDSVLENTTINPTFNFATTTGKIYTTLGVPFDKDQCTYQNDGDILTSSGNGYTVIRKYIGDGYDCGLPVDSGWVRADADWYCWSDENNDNNISTRQESVVAVGNTYTYTFGPPNSELPARYWAVYDWTECSSSEILSGACWYDDNPNDFYWDDDAQVAFRDLFFPSEKLASNKITSGVTEPFVQTINNKTIPFSFVVQPNTACLPENNTVPSVPALTFSTTTPASEENISITFESIDPDAGDVVEYQISFDGGTAITATSPFSKSWSYVEGGNNVHSVKVRAKDECGQSEWATQSVTIIKTNSSTLGEIIDLSATGSCGSVSLSWTGNGADTYQVFRKASTEPDFTSVSGTQMATTYVDSTVSNGTQYTYKIYSKKDTQEKYSNTATITPRCLSCSGTYSEGEITGPVGGVCTQYNCDTSTGVWTDSVVNCPGVEVGSPDFYFSPNIADSGLCPFYLSISGVYECELRNRIGTRSAGPFGTTTSPDTLVLPLGAYKAPIGTHTLYCSTPAAPAVFLSQGSSESCYSNSDVKER